MTKRNTFAKLALITAVMTMAQPAMSAIEMDEKDFGPSYGSTLGDAAVARPMQFAAASLGTVIYGLSYPFSYYGGNVEQAKRKLVYEPWNAMYRCLGCTVAEDKYYTNNDINPNVQRRIIGGKYELTIATEDDVSVEDPSGVVSQGW